MPKVYPRQGHGLSPLPMRKTNDAQLFAQKRACSRVKQANDLNFFTVQTDLTAPALP